MTHREFRELFEEFNAPSWATWNAIEDAIFGVAPSDPDLVRRVTGRTVLPGAPVAEFWAVKGRGGGGSRFVSRLASYCAAGRQYALAPGEHVYVGIFGPDRKQAGLTFSYIRGLLRSVPALAALVVNETRESIELSNGVVIEVITASTAAPRGRAYALVIIEEAAFLPTDNSAEPDRELIRSVRPALARVRGSLLAVISSPYAQEGELFRVWSEKFGQDDADVLVMQADTATLNPSFSEREIARAYREDPVAAEAEYGAAFRQDVSRFVSDETIAAVVLAGVRDRAPEAGRSYVAHLDAATGSGEDAAALGVAYHDGERAVLACVRQWKPPFSPSSMAREAAAVLRSYGESVATIDRFAPGLVTDLLRREGITARPAKRDTSDAFLDLLAAMNSDRCRLLDVPELLREVKGLERRPGAGGHDRIGHGPRGHDDVVAAAANALTAAREGEAYVPQGLLFSDPAVPTLPARMQRQVRELVGRMTARVQTAASSISEQLSGAVRRAKRPTRTAEEIGARKAEAERLRAARQDTDLWALTKAMVRGDQAEVDRLTVASVERARRAAQARRLKRAVLHAPAQCLMPGDLARGWSDDEEE